LPLVVASPAFATGFSINFGPSPRGGYGYNSGTITWTGQKSFNWEGQSTDVCPADAYGTSFYFYFHMGDGDYVLGDVKVWDTSGCDDAYNGYGTGAISKERRIDDVQVISCFTDDGNLCALVPVNGRGAWKDNPTW
jgi:hypothetical protein